MVTGDAEPVARAVAEQVGIDPDHVVAGVMPEDKVAIVARLQGEGHRVAMAGDGVNDAAALATADLGIAMGSGADVAMEASDLTIVSGALMGTCLLYTSDAADDLLCVDLGGRRIIKKKTRRHYNDVDVEL